MAYKDCLKKSTNRQKINFVLLMGLYYFYHNSPLNISNMKNSKILGIKPKMPTRVGGTRWIGHILLALTNFFHSYKAIVQHLEQVFC